MQTPEAHEHPNYPLSISEEEAQAGFRKLQVFGIADLDFAEAWYLVVARQLNDSELVVKTKMTGEMVVYSHKRFGIRTAMKAAGMTTHPSWNPINMFPQDNPKDAVFKAKSGVNEAQFGNEIEGQPAQILEA